MKFQLLNSRLSDLLRQRNLLMFGTASLLALNFLQALSLFSKNERVVIVPPEISQKFWVEKGQASSSYLEEMGLFFANLILDNSPQSAGYQREVVLRYAQPQGYNALKAQLLEDEERLNKEHLSTSFKPVDVKVHNRTNRVEVTGDLVGYVGDKRVTFTRDTYRIQLNFQKGRVYIVSFELIRSRKNA